MKFLEWIPKEYSEDNPNHGNEEEQGDLHTAFGYFSYSVYTPKCYANPDFDKREWYHVSVHTNSDEDLLFDYYPTKEEAKDAAKKAIYDYLVTVKEDVDRTLGEEW